MDIDLISEMKKKDKSLLLRLPGDMHRRLKIAAAESGVSMNEIVCLSLKYWVDEHPAGLLALSGRIVK